MQLDVNAALGAGASAVVVVGGLVAGYVGLRKWVQRAAAPAQAAADQLRTSNGTTIAGYVERADRTLTEVKSELDVLTTWAGENRDLAKEAITLARQANERLDAHLIGHDRPTA